MAIRQPMSAVPIKQLKFVARSCMTRAGVWRPFEAWRLSRRFHRGFVHEPEFRLFSHFERSRGLFIDVGANIGQSALSVRAVNRTCPIISFEPNPDMEFGLSRVRRLLGESFQFRMHGLGAATETRTLHVPYVKGVAFPQCATFRREAL